MSEHRLLVAVLAAVVLSASAATSLVVAEVRRGIEMPVADAGPAVYELVSDGPGLAPEPATIDAGLADPNVTSASNSTSASVSAHPAPTPSAATSQTTAPAPSPTPPPPSPSPAPTRHRTRAS